MNNNENFLQESNDDWGLFIDIENLNNTTYNNEDLMRKKYNFKYKNKFISQLKNFCKEIDDEYKYYTNNYMFCDNKNNNTKDNNDNNDNNDNINIYIKNNVNVINLGSAACFTMVLTYFVFFII